MKKFGWMLIGMFLVVSIFGSISEVQALSPETEMMLKLLQKKGLITQEEADDLRQEVQAAPAAVDEEKKVEEEYVGGVRGLEERYEELKAAVEGVEIGGTIEVEASYEDVDYDSKDEDDEDSSDISVATVELSVDAAITDRIKGHLLFLYEEDEDDSDVALDEAIIHIHAEEVCVVDEACGAPWYASIGKLYVPFGYYESHFISDPLTLELGETRETAVVAGLANNWANVAIGVYNGDVNEVGEDDDHIENFVASARLTLPEETIPGIGLMGGVSYVNDISDSDNLQDEVIDHEVEDFIAGFAAFLHVSVHDKFFLEAEYVAALDDFEESDMDLEPGEDFEPRTWNIELAYLITEALEVAIKYEGSDDALDFLPEKRYGGVINYSLFDNTSLGLEYLYGEFENNDEVTTVTGQLAVVF